MSNKSRNFQFTWNNYTDEDIEHLKNQNFKYLCFGKETAPETGTPHLQGMICFENPRSFNAVRKNIFLEKCHIEVVKSINAMDKYNKKDGNFEEYGEKPSGQGYRADLFEMKEMIDGGCQEKDLWEKNFAGMLQYRRGFERYMHLTREHRTEPPRVFWLFGKTGTGKTRFAFENHETVYIKDGTKWWNDYIGQEAIAIDDFDGAWPFRDLLRLLDRYPYSGQTKGDYVKVNSPYIYITCEYAPDHFWENDELAQVMRRIEIVHNMGDIFSVFKLEKNFVPMERNRSASCNTSESALEVEYA